MPRPARHVLTFLSVHTDISGWFLPLQIRALWFKRESWVPFLPSSPRQLPYPSASLNLLLWVPYLISKREEQGKAPPVSPSQESKVPVFSEEIVPTDPVLGPRLSSLFHSLSAQLSSQL